MSARGAASWYDFARAILDKDPTLADRRDLPIVPVATSTFPRPARRPRCSLLDCDHLERTFDINLGDWRAGLTRTLASPP